MRIGLWTFLLCALLIFPLCAAANGDDLYVSASMGSDMNDGTMDSPLLTLEEAITRLRWNPTSDRVTVWLREGTYMLEESIIMTEYDRANVTFSSYPGERAVITGSRPVTNWTETTYNGVRVFAAPYQTPGYVRALYGEDGARQLARWPKQGYLYAAGPIFRAEAGNKFQKQQGFFVNAGDLPGSLDGAIVRLFHWWKDELSGVRSYDPLRGELQMNRATAMTISEGDRYYLENVLTISMEPGEWGYDASAAILYYAPYEFESPDTLTLYAGHIEQLVYINGLAGITFENITFEKTAWNIPRGDVDSDFPQAAYDANATVIFMDVWDARVIGCTFRDIGPGCIVFGGTVKGGIVRDNTFERIGAQAVYIHGDNSPNDAIVTESIIIENNHIRAYGQNFMNAAAILIIHARNIDVRNNEIHNGTYTAISAGWVWGDGFSVTRSIRIQNNLIYNIGQRTLSDMGAIYLLGSQPGTVVNGNVIHDVSSHEYGGWGIYLDEGASQIEVSQNLVYRCSAQGYHQHAAKGNTVRNNIFANNQDGQVGLSTEGSFLLEGNILVGESPYFRNEGGTIRQGVGNLFTSDAGLFAAPHEDNYAITRMEGLAEIGFVPWVYNAGLRSAIGEDIVFTDVQE